MADETLAQIPTSDVTDFENALSSCTRVICETSGWPIGHALVADASRSKLVSSGAWCVAQGNGFREWREVRSRTSFAWGQGLRGLAWRSGATCTLPQDGDEFEASLANQADAPAVALAVPVKCGQQVVAVLEFFHCDSQADFGNVRRLCICMSALLGQLAESATRAADRARLAAIIEASDDAVIATDQAGVILSWNAGAERLYGYTRNEAVGTTLDLIVPDNVPEAAPVLTRVLRDARRLDQFETVRRRKNGQLIDVALTATPVFDRDGRVSGASSIERDITRRKRFELESARARAEAESANRAKSEFLANVSHELRTPMNAILGMLELSLDEWLPPSVQDYLSTAHDSAQALLFLLKDLLDFSRTEAGTFELERAPFALRSTIRHATRTLAIRAHEKGLELLCRIGRDVPDALEGDGRRVQQIIMNLVGNAIKFTDSGEIVVDVTLKSQQPDSVELLISVSDTGIGISKADQERIFLPFTQVDSTSTRKYSGTGLGLTITRELANRMDGRLWVESTPRRGSRFFCTLKLKPAPGTASEAPESAKSLAKLTGQRVLIIDDNESNRQIVAEIVRGWSMRPTVCANGETALAILRDAGADRFRLTIVDASMPGMDGYDFLETARRENLLHGAAIVMQSSGGRQVFDERQGPLGISALVEKPIGQLDLLNACVTALEGAKDPGERRRQITPTSAPLRILVAEDTPANQKVVSAILGKRGHFVHVVENGRDAVDEVQKGAFDVVLMDAQMPTMNGLQAAAAIRHIAHAERARVPIIAMTAHAMREDREKCLAAGMNDYLPKPIDAVELISVVEKYGRKPAVDENLASSAAASLKARGATRAASPSMVERFGGDRAVAQQFVQVFREESKKQAEIISEALDHGDPITAARAAHNLRGVAMYLDASALAAAAGALEEALAAGDAQALAVCRQQVQTELQSLLKSLSADKPKSA